MVNTVTLIKDLDSVGNITPGDEVVVERVAGQTRRATYRVELSEDTSPELGGNLNLSTYALVDVNGNELLKQTAVASAVNEITLSNAATGNGPLWEATGGDTNIEARFKTKGTGAIKLESANTTTPLQILSGTSYQHITNFSFSDTANTRTVTFPDYTGTVVLPSGMGTSGQIPISQGSSSQVIWSPYTMPTAAGAAGKILRSDGTNNVYSTLTISDTIATNSLLYASNTDTLSELTSDATAKILTTNSTGVPTWVSAGTANRIALSNATNGINFLNTGQSGEVLESTSTNPIWKWASRGVRAYASSNQTIATSTVTKLTLNTEEFDQDSLFASSRFTATENGYYLVTGAVTLNSPNDGTRVVVYIYKNGAEYARCQDVIGKATTATVNVVSIVNLAATEYVELYTFHDHGSDRDTISGANLVFISVGKMGGRT